MRGFLVGTLALVTLELATRRESSGRLGTGLAWAASGLQRLLSPAVAGVPNRTGKITVKVTP